MSAYLFHWTHRANLESIATTGLDPKYARGALRAVWMCEASRVMWAVGHVSTHHRCSPDDMVLLRIRVDKLELTRTAWPLVRVSKKRIPARCIVGVCEGIGERFVSIRRFVPR